MEFESLWNLFLLTARQPSLNWDEFLSAFRKAGGDHWTIYDIEGNISPLLWDSPTNRNKNICRKIMLQNAQALYSSGISHEFIFCLIPQYKSAKELLDAYTQLENQRKELGLFTPWEKISARRIQRAYRKKIERDARPEGKMYWICKRRFEANSRKL